MIIDFAQETDMWITSTYFDYKIIHRDSTLLQDKNQIDHILVKKKHTKSIKDVRSCRGANGNLGHILLTTKPITI